MAEERRRPTRPFARIVVPQACPSMTPQQRIDAADYFYLCWTTDHAHSCYGMGVLLDSGGEVFDWLRFTKLRHSLAACNVEPWIECEDVGKLVRALGITDKPVKDGLIRLYPDA